MGRDLKRMDRSREYVAGSQRHGRTEKREDGVEDGGWDYDQGIFHLAVVLP